MTNWGQRVVERVLSEQTLEDALLDLSNRSDLVADQFLGSGSTLIAAQKTGRVCRGVELDPLYVDVIVRRYELATGHAVNRFCVVVSTFADKREDLWEVHLPKGTP